MICVPQRRRWRPIAPWRLFCLLPPCRARQLYAVKILWTGAAVFAARPKTRILLEASTERAWGARCLEAWGHEVMVADTNYAPMYAQRSRRVKTDQRDVEALAHAWQLRA